MVTDPILVPFGGGEVVGDSTDRRVEILSDHETLNATWSRFGPGRDGADLHIHLKHVDLFYVLAGELTLELGMGGHEVTIPPGSLVRIPPLVVHGFRNASDREVRYLNLHAPGQGFCDYLRALRDGRSFSWDQHQPPSEGHRPPSEAVVGAREVVVDGPNLQVTLLTNGTELQVTEIWAAPGASFEGRIDEHRADSFYYVLEGELRLTTGDNEVGAGAGCWLQTAESPGYGLIPSSAEQTRFLQLRAGGPQS